MKKHLTYLLLLSLSTSLIACGEFDEEQELSEEEILLEASVLDLNDITSQEFALNGNTQQGAFCSLERLRNQARQQNQRGQNQRGQNQRGQDQQGQDQRGQNQGGQDSQAEAGEITDEMGARGPNGNRAKKKGKHQLAKILIKRAYDQDQDGVLNQEERETLGADLVAGCVARRAIILERFDLDADGTLNEEEKETLQQAQAERHAQKRAQHEAHKAEILETYDLDGDGALSRSEKEEVKAFHQAKLEEKVAEFEAQFDLDENGELDADEESELQAYVQEKISSGLPMTGPNSHQDVDQDE